MNGKLEPSNGGLDQPGIEVVPTRAGYDRWAEFYDREDNPLVLLDETHISTLAGEVVGLDMADIG
ncbi:MAG: hypothetical protein WCQ21_16675 [Verrucomicrobiota bacterium]